MWNETWKHFQEILATILIKHQLSTKCRWGSHNSLPAVYDRCGPVTTHFILGSASVSAWLHGGWTFHAITLPLHPACILLLSLQTLMLRSVRRFLLWLKWYCLPWVVRCWEEILVLGTTDDDYDDPDKECSSSSKYPSSHQLLHQNIQDVPEGMCQTSGECSLS